MEEWFYTDASRTQQGPVKDRTLLDLNQNGKINATSLVWKEGMLEWEPFSKVAAPLFGQSDDGILVEIGVCAHSKRIYPVSEMMPYGEALIGVEHKSDFVQRLMESGSTEIVDATESTLIYVGFWWRVLSSFLDYLVKLIPTYICMIPYYVVMFTAGASDDSDALGGMTVAGAVAYGVGLLGVLGISIFYETWMIGKHGSTLGKMAVGAKVVNPDGSKLTYGRAFLRWLAKKPLNTFIIYVPSTIALVLLMGIGFSTFDQDSNALGATAIAGGFAAYVLIAGLLSGVYWMCAFDDEKRTLHDRLCSTRVVKK